MTSTPIHVVLHGGLGNQLFQYLRVRAMIISGESWRPVRLYADLLGRYNSARSLDLKQLLDAEQFAGVDVVLIDAVSRLRLPKLLAKLTRKEWVWELPFHGAIVDGYFQHPSALCDLPSQALHDLVGGWRDGLVKQGLLPQAQDREAIAHMRLGDFFPRPGQALAYAAQRLEKVPNGTDILTDQEAVVAKAIAEAGRTSHLQVVPSSTLEAWQLLKLMARYKRVATNGSTLAFWSAALGGSDLLTSNALHQQMFPRLQAVKKN